MKGVVEISYILGIDDGNSSMLSCRRKKGFKTRLIRMSGVIRKRERKSNTFKLSIDH